MIQREAQATVAKLADQYKAVAIIGPRQSGKTTLSRMCFPNKAYVSLETPTNREFASSDPIGFLNQFPDGAILDEIQRVPDLFSWLQERLDTTEDTGRFVLTGSNNFQLLEKISQSLAGRVGFIELLPFSINELKNVPGATDHLNLRLLKGGYPSIQAKGIDSETWFAGYIRTYVERDVRLIKNIENLALFQRLLSLCAGRVGQLLNYSNLANEVGVDYKTIQSWLGVLRASYIIYTLQPYHRNFNKRLVKSPKLYFYDTGLASNLLQITETKTMNNHPLRGALFENFVINELIKNRFNQGKRSNLYFWRTRTGHEVDVIIDKGISQYPIEIKSAQTIHTSFFKAITQWNELTTNVGGAVIYGGDQKQERSSGVNVLGWRNLAAYE